MEFEDIFTGKHLLLPKSIPATKIFSPFLNETFDNFVPAEFPSGELGVRSNFYFIRIFSSNLNRTFLTPGKKHFLIKIMKSIILLISVLLIGHKSIAQDWVYIGAGSEGTKWYVRSSYVTKDDDTNGGSIKIWTKMESKKRTVKKNGKALTYTNTEELQLIFTDCNDKRVKLITTTVYNSQGKIVDSVTLEDYEQEWRDVVPDSMGEAVLNKICQLFN